MIQRPDSLLLYGATDVGKTAQLGELALWENKRTGRISRLVSADSGWDPIESLIISTENPQGIIEAWNIQSLADPWVIWVELSEGAWPAVKQDSAGAWKISMIRPTWRDGALLASDGRAVGQYLLEGLSTFCATGMQDHVRAGRRLAQDVVGTFSSTVTESQGGKETARSMSFSAPAMAHYGQVQKFMLEELVPRFGRLGVSRVVWTAHEARGTDDITGIANSVLGPATVGKAYVDKTTMKFGHTFHMTVDTQSRKDPKGNDQISRDFRAWFVSHPDALLQKMNWPAKVSLPITKAKALLAKYPGGYLPLNEGTMAQFLEFLAEDGAGK